MKTISKKNLFSISTMASSLLGLCFMASPASAAVFTQIADGDIFTNSTDGEAIPSAFTAVSGNTLNIGSTTDLSGRFDATATAVNSSNSENPAPIVNVYGTSSLEFAGNNNATRTQSLTVNFEDESQFLINADNAIFRERVVINYNSSAASSSTGDLRLQNAGTFAIFNFNSGFVSVAELQFNGNAGLVNLNGGIFSATSLGFNTGGPGNINFANLGSAFTLVGAANIDALNTQIAEGLFQIDGVDQTSLASYNRSFSGGDLTITAIPEPTSALAGLLLGAGLLRRRRSA